MEIQLWEQGRDGDKLVTLFFFSFNFKSYVWCGVPTAAIITVNRASATFKHIDHRRYKYFKN